MFVVTRLLITEEPGLLPNKLSGQFEGNTLEGGNLEGRSSLIESGHLAAGEAYEPERISIAVDSIDLARRGPKVHDESAASVVPRLHVKCLGYGPCL